MKKYPNGVQYKILEDELLEDFKSGNFYAEGDIANSLRAMIFHNGDKNKYGDEIYKFLIGHIETEVPKIYQNDMIIHWKE